MMKTLRITLLLAVLSMAVFATADDHGGTFTWTPPETRVNGDEFDVTTELDRYEIACESDSTSVTMTVEGYSDISEYTPDSERIFGDNYGVYDCHIWAVDTEGLASDKVGPLALTWPEPPSEPSPPADFRHSSTE